MTRYLEILGPRPFENGVDNNDRAKWTMNFDAMAAAPVGQWAFDLQKILADASLSTKGTDTFIGPDKTLPTGDGPFIRIIETGAVPSEETHNGSEYEMLSALISVSAQDRVDAETRALAVWREINRTRDTTVTP